MEFHEIPNRPRGRCRRALRLDDEARADQAGDRETALIFLRLRAWKRSSRVRSSNGRGAFMIFRRHALLLVLMTMPVMLAGCATYDLIQPPPAQTRPISITFSNAGPSGWSDL